MNPILQRFAAYGLARLKESSTWLGIIAVVLSQYAHLTMTQTQEVQLATVAATIVGAVVAFFPQTGVLGQVAAEAAQVDPNAPPPWAAVSAPPPVLAAPTAALVPSPPAEGAGKGPANYE